MLTQSIDDSPLSPESLNHDSPQSIKTMDSAALLVDRQMRENVPEIFSGTRIMHIFSAISNADDVIGAIC